jgi:hypothetical protein
VNTSVGVAPSPSKMITFEPFSVVGRAMGVAPMQKGPALSRRAFGWRSGLGAV